MKRPNILLIMADNQPADAMGCYGNSEVQTPHLDALAARGVRFGNAFCANAMCSPCRASVLTGLMPSQHGVHNWLDDRLVEKWPENWAAIGEFNTLPALMKRAGYATALIGKYHLGVPFEPQLEFDHWVTFPHGHTTSFYGNDIIDGDTRDHADGHSVDYFTDKTIEYLETRAEADDPFFAFVPLNGPYGHWPSIAGRAENEFADLYDDCPMDSIPREGLNPNVLDRFAQRVERGAVRDQFKGPLILPNDREALRNYYSQITLVDHNVGRIVEALDRLNLSEDTLIIYTADHGFSLGHNGIWGHAAASFPASGYRPSYQVPMIFAGGGIAEGVAHDGLMHQIDLFPTLARLAGSDETPSLASDARDLASILNDGRSELRDAVFIEQEETRAIRTEEWLYVKRFKDAPGFPMGDELYHLPSDPEEKTNLIDLPDHAEIIAELSDRIDKFFKTYAEPKYDLWSGGTVKSNATFPAFWQDAWGQDWRPDCVIE